MNKYLRDALTFPRDARRACAYDGTRGIWRELRVRTLDRVTERGVSIVLEHVMEDVSAYPLPAGVRLENYAGPDWSPFVALTSTSRTADFARRVASGRECLVAWRGDVPVGFAWISTRMDPAIEHYDLPLPADAIYHWDLLVHSSERGNGLGMALAFGGFARARARNFRVTWRVIDVDNTPSLNGARKASTASTRVVGTVHFRRMLARSRHWYSADLSHPEVARVSATFGGARSPA